MDILLYNFTHLSDPTRRGDFHIAQETRRGDLRIARPQNSSGDFHIARPNQAILIRNHLIHAYGEYNLLNVIAYNPIKLDLEGNVLLPAFTDAHTHFLETAKRHIMLDVSSCTTEESFYNQLVRYRDSYQNILKNLGYDKPLQWIKGMGWEKKTIEKLPNINIKMLDKVFGDMPVSIASKDLHSSLCNTAALKSMGLLSNSSHPLLERSGVVFDRLPCGSFSGFIYENAWTALDNYIPALSSDLLEKLIQKQIDKCHRYGLCGVPSIEDIHAAQTISSIAEKTPFYFTWYYLNINPEKRSDFIYKDHFVKENRHFRNAGIKLFTDGALGSDTAWMFDSATNTPAQKQILSYIKTEIALAHAQDIQVAVHAIGDYASYATASIFKEIHRQNPKDLKHRIEHLQAVRPEDISLLKEANIHASMQSIHIKDDMETIQKKWHKAKNYSFPIKSISKAVELALGSDAPVETLNPLEGVKFAVYRQNFIPSEALSLSEALDAYTYKHHTIANKPITYGLLKKDQIANLTV